MGRSFRIGSANVSRFTKRLRRWAEKRWTVSASARKSPPPSRQPTRQTNKDHAMKNVLRYRFDFAPMTGEIAYDLSDPDDYVLALKELDRMRGILKTAGVTITKET